MKPTKLQFLESIHSKSNESFCVMPFMSVTAHQTGAFRICCEDVWVKEKELLGNIKDVSINEMMNSKKMKEIRLKMIEWKKLPECKICDLKKARWVRSKRDINNKLFSDDLESIFDTTDFETGETHQDVKYIDVRFSNICNLACRMCWSGSSSSRVELDKLTRNFSMPVVQDIWKIDDFKEVIQTIDMVYIAGWEPFIDKNFDSFLEYIIASWRSKEIILKLNTNLTVFLPKHVEYFSKFKLVQMVVSCDGYGEVFEYIRIGAKWKTFLKNLIALKRAFPQFWEGSRIDLNTVVQIDNVHNIPKLHHFCHKMGVKNNLSILQVPEYMYVWVMPDIEKLQILDFYKKFISEHENIPKIQKNFSEIIHILESWGENETLYWNYLNEKKLTDRYVHEKSI